MNSAPAKPPPITPEMLPKLYVVGEQSILLNRLDEAAWCFEKAAEFDPASPQPLLGLAKVRQLQERPADARKLMAEAITRGGGTAQGYTILGQICQAEGDFEDAIAAFEQAVAVDPNHGPAYLRLALLGRPEHPAARIAELERLAAAPDLAPDQLATLGFALGRLYETEADHDRAFARYKSANDIRSSQYPGYSNTFRSADPMIRVFDRGFMRAHTGFGDPSESLVFVVGMMRSGTTLVEQILASHPDVQGHGERSDIRQFAAGIAGELGDVRPYPACLASLDAVTASRYAALYRGRLERDAPGARRHIDKLPHNFEHLGLIALLYPRARIIHCSRDPIDTCLSNYFQDFGPLNPFTYDLAALGNYHREYQRLMAHWESVLPNPLLRIPYEQLVADPERWSRAAVAFLGLEWDDACLSFHATERPVFTKSLWQVRQPIFRTSIDRWRPYERHLGPLVEALQG